MNKKIILILILITSMILITGALFFIFFKHTNKIEKKMQGVIISKDSLEFIEHVTITIHGNIEKNDAGFTFIGELYLSNLEYSKGKNSLLLYNKGYDVNNTENGIISYVRNIIVNGNAIPDYATIHWVNTDLDFSYLILANYEEDCINNPSEDSIKVYNGNDILVFPATDAEAALKLIKEHQINQEIFQKTSVK